MLSGDRTVVMATDGTERDEERLRALLEIVQRTRKLYVAPDVLAQFCETARRVATGVDHLCDAPYYVAGVTMYSRLGRVELIASHLLDPGVMVAIDTVSFTTRTGLTTPP